MTIDPRAMRSFLAVCRGGSISEAARRLQVTQPAVSATMAQLEQTLGTTLFTRARSGIQLTAAGAALRRRAEAMEAVLEQAEREVSLVKEEVAGPLVIGGTPGALSSLLPSAVERVKQRYPAFELQVLERSDAQLTELLRAGRIDFAIGTTGIEPLPEDLEEEAILRDPFAILVGKRNEHLPSRISLRAIDGLQWVLPHAGGAFRRQIDALFVASEARAPVNVIRCDSLLTTKAIVRKTDCVTILPREVAAAELSIGVLRAIEIEGSTFARAVGIRTARGRRLSPFSEAFVEAVRQLTA